MPGVVESMKITTREKSARLIALPSSTFILSVSAAANLFTNPGFSLTPTLYTWIKRF